MRTEQRSLNKAIILWTQKQVFAIARKTLADLAATSLEERMGDVFVNRVRALTGAAKEQLETAFKTSNHTVSVHSAFDLPPAQRTAIESAVQETFASEAQVQFETAPELVSGIELSTGGHKIAWSIADYLSTLEKSAGELLHEEAGPESKPDARPQARGRGRGGGQARGRGRRPSPTPTRRSRPSSSQSVNPETALLRCPWPQRRTIELLA